MAEPRAKAFIQERSSSDEGATISSEIDRPLAHWLQSPTTPFTSEGRISRNS